MAEEPIDLGDEKQVKAAKRKHKSKERIEQEELKALLEHRAFRTFLWTLLSDCGITRLSYAGESTHETAFHEGMRNIGHKVIARIEEVKPHSYMAIYNENRKD